MNPLPILLAAAILAPAAALGYARLSDDPVEPASVAGPSAGNLQIVLDHVIEDQRTHRIRVVWQSHGRKCRVGRGEHRERAGP